MGKGSGVVRGRRATHRQGSARVSETLVTGWGVRGWKSTKERIGSREGVREGEKAGRVAVVGCNGKRGNVGRGWTGVGAGRFARHGMGGSRGLQETETWPNRN